jgi:hypothetical protein
MFLGSRLVFTNAFHLPYNALLVDVDWIGRCPQVSLGEMQRRSEQQYPSQTERDGVALAAGLRQLLAGV